MTTLETILITSLWIITGFWISHKRGWYKGNRFGEEAEFMPQSGDGDRILRIVLGIIGSPISLLVAFIIEFVIRDWEKDK